MRIEGRRYRDEWIPNYYPPRDVAGKRVRLSRTGSLIVLEPEEDDQLNEIFMDEGLFDRLEDTGHVVSAANAQRVIEDLQRWQLKTYLGPMLHIVVATKRCNLNCTYCHMNPEPATADRETYDLTPEVAQDIVRFAMGTPSPTLKFEFQGGEPFLNFEGMVDFVERAREGAAAAGKRIDFTVVSNLMIANDEQLRYCYDEGIDVSYSLNGPQDLHDRFRITRSGTGSFGHVMKRIAQVQKRFPGLISTSPLCVIGGDNAPHLRRMLDFYHEAGFKGVAILRLKNLGNAKSGKLRFDVREFLPYYLDGLDYLVEKNRGFEEVYAERSLRVVLAKIFSKSDVGFVDWRNPCGDFSGALTYDYDGEILPSDEARSLRHEFGLGNVRDTTYRDLVERKETFRTMNLSLRDRDPECRECPYNPYCGVLPILDYSRTGDPEPIPHESEECLFTLGVLDWTFRQLIEDPLPLVRMLPGLAESMLEQLETRAAASS
jgi:uncharacterized protein